MNNSKRSQKGAFAIELTMVLIVFLGIYLFMTDISHKLLVRSQLDRVSFALVNILKERTRFYGGVATLNDSDRDDMQALAYRMLGKEESDLAIKIEALHNKTSVDVYTSAPYEALGCQATDISEKGALAPVEEGTIYSLYQVTLCDQADSWFANFWGNSGTPTFTITSSSVVAGR
ncbi:MULTISPECIES: tight adherence pilus pseudopilin TadF [Vibrio]|uniref:tight adherence pilus pseudopilin TadF n=1 Tax=Vibrio TaxID=662 RepID=UPI003D0FDCED